MDQKANNKRKQFLLISLVMIIFCNSAYAWWTEPNNTHYLLTLRSYKQLQRANLYHEVELRKGANSPDDIGKVGKVMQHHRHYNRVRKNYNAALNSYSAANLKQTAWILASAFHYIQDAIDVSTLFNDDYKEGIRNTCHEAMQNWREVMSHPDMYRTYWNTYNSELQIMRGYNLKRTVRRLQDKKIELGRTMKSILKASDRKGELSEYDAKQLTKILLKCVATMQSAQDLMLEQFVYRYRGQ